MKDKITHEIKSFVKEYEQQSSVITRFGDPLIGFADANSSFVQNLPDVVGASHTLPQHILDDASVIIAYYVPFTKELAMQNSQCSEAAPSWARAYEELNAMFLKLNRHILEVTENLGFRGAVPPAASTFDRCTLTSDWSQRHIAYAAGLGTFGINNMLITRTGCCGRFNSVITNIPVSEVSPDKPMEEELCLYKKNGSCGFCVSLCPSGALHTGDAAFARESCYQRCLENAALYPAGCFDEQSAISSADSPSSYSGSLGSEVCGKCVTGAPCAFMDI